MIYSEFNIPVLVAIEAAATAKDERHSISIELANKSQQEKNKEE